VKHWKQGVNTQSLGVQKETVRPKRSSGYCLLDLIIIATTLRPRIYVSYRDFIIP
jgi:hypothetical protein